MISITLTQKRIMQLCIILAVVSIVLSFEFSLNLYQLAVGSLIAAGIIWFW